MPILANVWAVFPDDLLDNAAAGGPEGMATDFTQGRRWFVLHTRPQQEKILSRELVQKAIPYYLPLVSRRRRYQRRVITSYLPLFPGYLPVLIDDEERIAALATRRVVHALPVPDQKDFYNDLRRLERLLAAGFPVTPEARLSVGDQVVIRSGPLRGLEGAIIRTDNGRRFVIQVDFIQRGASVVADDFDIALK